MRCGTAPQCLTGQRQFKSFVLVLDLVRETVASSTSTSTGETPEYEYEYDQKTLQAFVFKNQPSTRRRQPRYLRKYAIDTGRSRFAAALRAPTGLHPLMSVTH